MKRLESLSYNLVETEKLKEVLKSTKQLEQSVQDMIPSETGLIIRQDGVNSVIAGKIKLKYKQYKLWKGSKKYSSLPKARKYGRPKTQRLRRRKTKQVVS